MTKKETYEGKEWESSKEAMRNGSWPLDLAEQCFPELRDDKEFYEKRKTMQMKMLNITEEEFLGIERRAKKS